MASSTHQTILPHIRRISPPEIPRLKDFLYEAIFIPEGAEKPERDIIELPELSKYIDDFGRKGDICLVAEYEGELVGAIWTRLFNVQTAGYGFVDPDTPELSMSVERKFRSKGIGSLLLGTMLTTLMRRGYEKVSLSVDKQNFALYLYLKFGFSVVKEDDKSAVLIKKFNT